MKHARGAALVLTLWLVALGTMLAFHYAEAVRIDTRIAAANLARVQARAAAEAGIWLSLSEIMAPQSDVAWPIDGSPVEFEYHEAKVAIRVQDISGLADLNTANEELLTKLVSYVLDEPERAAEIVDRIIDWRDPDHDPRVNGAEDVDYTAAGTPYEAKDGPFNSREELQLILGLTLDDYRRIAPFVTVYSQKQTVNVGIAPEYVLNAIDEEPASPAQTVRRFGDNAGTRAVRRDATVEILARAEVRGSISRIAATIDIKQNRRRQAKLAIINWSETWPMEIPQETIDEHAPSG
ncbi:MAG: general secretion pathway protein GspK [Gammaproteobacteria bacterium]|jgi:general secretion pathway protein K